MMREALSAAVLLTAALGPVGASAPAGSPAPAALRVAKDNAEALGMADRAAFRLGDWTAGITQAFDLILCNPPYVEDAAPLEHGVSGYEPHSALFAGADGLDCYRVLAPRLADIAAPHAVACMEIGWTQADGAGALFAAAGWVVDVRRDLGGRPRCLVLERRSATPRK